MPDPRARARLPSVLNPNVQSREMEEMTLRDGTGALAKDNDQELSKLLSLYRNSFETPTLPAATTTTSSNPQTSLSSNGKEAQASFGSYVRTDSKHFPSPTQKHASPATPQKGGNYHPLLSLQEETRRAKEALGMRLATPVKTPRSPLASEMKTELVAALPPVVVDICIYNPFGTFILPCHDLTITSDTDLRMLVISLQGILDNKIKNQDFARGPLLVSVIQVKIFNQGKYNGFPKIRGELGGNKVVHPHSESVASPSSSGEGHHASASAYERGELDEAEIPCAEKVNWILGPGSEEERYWREYRVALQIFAVDSAQKSTSTRQGLGQEIYKKPMIKVMTVVKVGLLSMFLGVHTFEHREAIQEEIQESPKVTESKDKGKGREKSQGDNLISSIRAQIHKTPRGKGLNVGDTEIEFAIEFAKNLHLQKGDGKSTATMANQLVQFLKDTGCEPMRQLTPKSSDESLPGGCSLRGYWSTYQRLGGDPQLHELFPLDHIPFEKKDLDWKDPDVGAVNEHLRLTKEKIYSPNTPPVEMVAYSRLDPKLIEMLVQDQSTVDNAEFKERKDMAVGFDEVDDDKFLKGAMSPIKAQAHTSSPLEPIPTEPFPNFHMPSHENLHPFQMPAHDSPLQHLGNLNPQHLSSDLETILNRTNTGSSNNFDGQGLNNQQYNLSGTPTPMNGLSHFYTRTPSPIRTVANPRGQSRWQRSPSPNKNRFVPGGNNMQQNNTADMSNFLQSFAYNTAAPEMNNQADAQAFYNTSPTKTHAQMSRAFNSPAMNNFSSPLQNQNYQGSHQFGNISTPPTHTSTPFNPNLTNDTLNAFNYQTPQGYGNIQGQIQIQSTSSQVPAIDAPSTGNVQGTSAFYSGVTTIGTPSSSTFNIGAGTSRGWNGSGSTSVPRNARPTGGYVRRPANQAQTSQLRADSPSFYATGGGMSLTANPGRGRAASASVRGVSAAGADGGQQKQEQSQSGQQQNAPAEQPEREFYMGAD
ncbi:hypothetical protein EG329_000998 [Mollisiaceae sp. DMI_Dod_QoI]|nr:hypothetical protein EG329_000998 [Helotiales sp. DMI_Dod_QoI]